MKNTKLVLLAISALAFSSTLVAKPTDDTWVHNDNPYYDHVYHSGTVNEATTRASRDYNRLIDENKKKANAGIAGATALSSIPTVPNKYFSLGAGIGSYRDGGAVAVGFTANPQGTDLYIKSGFAITNESDPVFQAGFAYGW